MVTYYDVLGVDDDASDAEIKSSYTELVKQYHPDQADHPDSAALFEDIKQAKEGLIGSGPRVTQPLNEHGSHPPLNYDWKSGEPVEPNTSSTGGGERDENDGGDERDDTGEGGNEEHTHRDSHDSNRDSSDDDSNPWDSEGRRGDDFSDDDIHGPRTGASVTSEDSSAERGLGRRGVVAALATGIGGLAAGSLLDSSLLGGSGTNDGEQDGTVEDENKPEQLRIEPGESLQDGIEGVQTGGTVEVAAGTYRETVLIDKAVSVVAPDGAVLDGVDTEDSAAISVADSGVAIQGLEITRFDKGGIRTTTSVSDIEITDVELLQNGGVGVGVEAEQVVVENTTVENSGDTGMRISSTSQGSVTIRESVVRASQREVGYGDVESEGRGVNISGGQTVTVENLEAVDNGAQNLRITGGDVRGQSISIDNSSVVGSGLAAGIRVSGTEGEDTVSISNTEVRDSENYGLDVVADDVTVDSITVEDAGDTGVNISSTPRGTVDVNGVVVKRSQRDVSYGDVESEGRGVNVSGGQTVSLGNIEAVDNGGQNIRVSGGDVRGQSVSIRDSLSAGNKSLAGIRIEGTDGEDDVTVTNTEVTGSSNYGIILSAESAEVDSVSVEASGNTGVRVLSSPEGTATVMNSVVNRSERETNYGGVESQGRGVSISGGKTVTVENIEAVDNGGQNIYVEGGDVRGQSITIRDSSVQGSKDGSGVYTGATDGTDENSIVNVGSGGNSQYGFDLGGDSVTIKSSSARENGEGQLNLRNTARGEATIENSF